MHAAIPRADTNNRKHVRAGADMNEEDMKSAAETLKLESIVEPIHYYSATGIELVTKFESTIEEGSTCWRLWNDKKKETLGIIGIIIEEILSFELICNRLASWERKDITRDSWRKKLKVCCRIESLCC